MSFVTDPDNLDRYQVVFSPEDQTISIKGLGADRVAARTDGDSDGTTNFTSAGGLFQTNSVAAGDIVSIISDPGADGGIIGHYEVQSVTSETVLVVDRTIVASLATDLDFKIAPPDASTGPAGAETLADGLSGQALYSFAKEEWRTKAGGLGANVQDLINFPFPFVSITREQYEVGGDAAHGSWAFDDLLVTIQNLGVPKTRELIRTAGWQEKDSAGKVIKDYVGVVTLGSLNTDTAVYFQQHAITADPIDFVLTGVVNQAVNTYDLVTGPDGGTGFAIATSNTITRADGGNWATDGYVAGGNITIINADTAGNNGTWEILSVEDGVDGDLVVVGTPLTNDAVDNTMEAAVDKRTFLTLFARKKARSYVQSAIADIGVTTLETLVNRFPLTHATDPAITLDDGQLAGDPAAAQQVFQAVEDHSTDTVGATVHNGDGTFEFTSAAVSPAFNDGVLQPGDSVEITTGSAGIQGFYEIAEIVDADTVKCFDEPLKGITPDESSLTFTARTATLDAGLGNATLADVTGVTGTLTSATATFTSDEALGDRIVNAGDMVTITAGDAGVIGTYKVISRDSDTVLTLDTTDQIFNGETSQTYIVRDVGMHLQHKSVAATLVNAGNATDLTFDDTDAGHGGDPTIVRATGDFTADGYAAGTIITVTSADIGTNNGTFTVQSVATTSTTDDTLVLRPSDVLALDANDVNAEINGENGFARTINNEVSGFNWRLFTNGGDLGDAFHFIQRELRRGRGGPSTTSFDIDESTDVFRGDVADLLMSFVDPNGTGLNTFFDDLVATEFNNTTFNDILDIARNFAFIAGITISINQNLLDDGAGSGFDINRVIVFFTDPDETPATGDEFGTNGAIIVQDDVLADMSAEDVSTSPLSFSFDYDNNAQGGHGAGTDAAITIVGIGLDSAQYVQTTGTIIRANSNVFSLVAALERNFANPT